MAWTSGTATDYRDLLDKLRLFLTSTMTPASERWTQLRWDTTSNTQELILRAPGLSGTDEIYVGIRSSEDAGAGYYRWQLQGYIGYNSANSFTAQPGALTTMPGVKLWNSSIPYWFVANGRRCVMVCKVGTVYEAMYLGFIRPYATPGQYPYPLLIGGSTTGFFGWLISDTSADHSHFAIPGIFQNNGNYFFTACQLRDTNGVWRNFWSFYQYNTGNSEQNQPLTTSASNRYAIWPHTKDGVNNIREAPDGTRLLLPLILVADAGSPSGKNILGELDGCFYVSGFGVASEDTVTVSGVDHFIVQNVYRTDVNRFWALRLE
jgi:hypothetical protein